MTDVTVWTGGTDTDWHTAGNWDDGVPSTSKIANNCFLLRSKNLNHIKVKNIRTDRVPVIINHGTKIIGYD